MKGLGYSARSSYSCTLTDQDGVGLFPSVWELELRFDALPSNFPLLGWGLLGSENAFSSHRHDYVVPPVQFIGVLFLLPSWSRRHRKPQTHFFWKDEEARGSTSLPSEWR